MMMVPDLATPYAGEKFFCPIGASARERIGFLMIDPLHFELAVKIVPRPGFVRMDHGAGRDPRLDE